MNYILFIAFVLIFPLINLYLLMPGFLLFLSGLDFQFNSFDFFFWVTLWLFKLSGLVLGIGLFNPRWIFWKNNPQKARDKIAWVFGSIFYGSFLNLGAISDYALASNSVPLRIFREILNVFFPLSLLMMFSSCLFFFCLLHGLVKHQGFFGEHTGKETRKKVLVVYGILLYLSLLGAYIAAVPFAGV